MAKDTSPKFVTVPEPATSPVSVILKSSTLKSKVLSLSSYVTEIPDSVFVPSAIIVPTVSDIVSAKVIPLTVIASASKVPSTSTLPDISNDVATSSPVSVIPVPVLTIV